MHIVNTDVLSNQKKFPEKYLQTEEEVKEVKEVEVPGVLYPATLTLLPPSLYQWMASLARRAESTIQHIASRPCERRVSSPTYRTCGYVKSRGGHNPRQGQPHLLDSGDTVVPGAQDYCANSRSTRTGGGVHLFPAREKRRKKIPYNSKTRKKHFKNPKVRNTRKKWETYICEAIILKKEFGVAPFITCRDWLNSSTFSCHQQDSKVSLDFSCTACTIKTISPCKIGKNSTRFT